VDLELRAELRPGELAIAEPSEEAEFDRGEEDLGGPEHERSLEDRRDVGLGSHRADALAVRATCQGDDRRRKSRAGKPSGSGCGSLALLLDLTPREAACAAA